MSKEREWLQVQGGMSSTTRSLPSTPHTHLPHATYPFRSGHPLRIKNALVPGHDNPFTSVKSP